MKRRRRPSFESESSEAVTTARSFASMAASIFRRDHNPYSNLLLRNHLKRLRKSLLRPSPNLIPAPVVALLPPLLNCRDEKIASAAAELVGLASLASIEVNEMIAMDEEIVRGLIRCAVDCSRSVAVAVAACNAVLDLVTTGVGRRRMLEFSALESFMFAFCQVRKLSKAVVGLSDGGKWNEECIRIAFVDNELQMLIFTVMMTLVNSCNMEQLETVQCELSKRVVSCLQEIWTEVHKQSVCGNRLDCKNGSGLHLSNFKPFGLAESLFRLSVNAGESRMQDSELVMQIFFGTHASGCGFRTFIMNHWEQSSFVLKGSLRPTIDKWSIFGSFARLLKSEEAISFFLSSYLPRMVSCLPFASDDLNILDFLEGVNDTLGSTVKYKQDIRVVKTKDQTEIHFLPNSSESHCDYNLGELIRCQEGFKQGYTIALRGLEFRFKAISAVADAIASLFGQPSVGANLYLTPPNSQGLARHYDDHCVFVFQLIGSKEWTILEHPTVQLPRLYEPLHSPHFSDVENAPESRNHLLKEGNVLYIPRGLAHEACTNIDVGEFDGTNQYSLHLTFGIEVEPPFEWEGFAHVSLHCWSHNQDLSVDSLSVHLLHFAIRELGVYKSDFRKACLAAAIPTPLDDGIWLEDNQRNYFNHIVSIMNNQLRYTEAIRGLKAAFHDKEDPFRWLGHLNEDISSSRPSVTVTELYNFFHEDKQDTEANFIRMKSNFCNDIVFADVLVKYKTLLEKYRKARKQYANGMLSLHNFDC